MRPPAHPSVGCWLCASVRAGGDRDRRRGPQISHGEVRHRLADAQHRVDELDLAGLAGLPPARPAPERLGDPDDVRGGVIAHAYAVLGRPGIGLVPTSVARAVESGAGLLARSVAGLYIPPFVGGGGRIVLNVPVVAGAMAREDPADRDALASLVVAHERTHHLQHGPTAWQDAFLAEVERFMNAGDRRAQRDLGARAQAVMAVVEGHASYVEMRAVEELHGPDLWWRVRGRHLDRPPGGVLASLMSVLFASKRDQYKLGMLFTADVVDVRDDAPSVLFGAPEGMPRPDELEVAERWVARVGAR